MNNQFPCAALAQNAAQPTQTQPAIRATILAAAAQIADSAALALTGLISANAYLSITGTARMGALPWHYLAAIAATTLVAVALFQATKLYTVQRLGQIARSLPGLVIGWTVAVLALVLLMFLTKTGENFSRAWILMWFASGATALFGMRMGITTLVSRWQAQGRLTRRAVIVGAGPRASDLIASLRKDAHADIDICGVFDDRAAERFTEPCGAPLLGRLEDLVAFARTNRVDDVLVTLPATAETRLLGILSQLSVLPVDIRLAANVSRLRFQPRAYSYIGAVPFIDIFERPIGDWGAVAKWLFDKAIAATALVLLAPVLIGVAIAIRMDSRGPILFRQKRYGFNNELIEVFKFRSMYVDMADANAAKLVTKDDPRVTPVGRIIRKTSLDELPQLFNVLRGDLSLVGPRPHAVQAKAANRLYHDVVDDYFARHKVKPGITGWAQINGWRGETDTEEKIAKRVEHDLYYIENWSILLDAYILTRTPFALLDTKSAY